MKYMRFAVFHDIPGINMCQPRLGLCPRSRKASSGGNTAGDSRISVFLLKNLGFLKYPVVELCAVFFSVESTFFCS